MSVLYIVLPLALLVVGVAVVAFLWAARKGQFDDLETPALRALHDDPAPKPPAGGATPTSKESSDGGPA